jgi:hypothetical protein
VGWEPCGAWDGPGDRSRGPVWRGVGEPVTITVPMAVHTLGNIVTGQERPAGDGGGGEEGKTSSDVVCHLAGAPGEIVVENHRSPRLSQSGILEFWNLVVDAF